MGRQAEFFATPEDIKELVDFFISRGGQIFDKKNGNDIGEIIISDAIVVGKFERL